MIDSVFLRFCAIGTIGFIVDAGFLIWLTASNCNPYSARIISFLVASCFTWWSNRNYTFRASKKTYALSEWLNYTFYMTFGAGVNYGVYAISLSISQFVYNHPAIGVAIGSIAGLSFNFLTSRFLVFKNFGK